MRLNPHLNFAGKCEAAFKFYEQCLGGKITYMVSYGETPAAKLVTPEWRTKIMHATLMVGNYFLQGADAFENYQKPQGFSVNLNIDNPAEADRVFAALAESAAIMVPMQETFWARRFGMLVDRFGIPWMINCGKATADGPRN